MVGNSAGWTVDEMVELKWMGLLKDSHLVETKVQLISRELKTLKVVPKVLKEQDCEFCDYCCTIE